MKAIFIDTETTGTDPTKHGVIQIAGAIFIEGQFRERFNLYAQPFPTDAIEDEALEVTGKTRDEIENYLPPLAVKLEFAAILAKYVRRYDSEDKFHMFGYNADFDYKMLKAWFEKCDDKYFGSWFFWPPIDVAQLAAFYLMGERHRLPSFSLMTVAIHLGLQVDDIQQHDAWSDIRLTMRLFRKVTGGRQTRDNSSLAF